MKRHPPGCAQCGETGLSSFVITACGAGEIKLCVACNESPGGPSARPASCQSCAYHDQWGSLCGVLQRTVVAYTVPPDDCPLR